MWLIASFSGTPTKAHNLAKCRSCSGYKTDKFAGSIVGLASVEVGDCWGTGKHGAAVAAGGGGKKQKKAKDAKADNPFTLLEEEGGGAEAASKAAGDVIKREMAVAGCAAHLQAAVVAHSELDDNHWVITCQVRARAFQRGTFPVRWAWSARETGTFLYPPYMPRKSSDRT